MVVNSVENSVKILLAMGEETVQSCTKLLGLADLLGVLLADRGDHIGKVESGLQEIELAVRFNTLRFEKILRKSRLGKGLGRE